MPFYTLRPGQQCAHDGKDLQEGEVIELPVHVGKELRDKLMPTSQDGESLDDLDADDLAVAQAQPHEVESLRAAAKERKRLAEEGQSPDQQQKPNTVDGLPVQTGGKPVSPAARPNEPNQEVGVGQGPDPLHTAPKKAAPASGASAESGDREKK